MKQDQGFSLNWNRDLSRFLNLDLKVSKKKTIKKNKPKKKKGTL